mgnify:CR=1 FL=1
MKGPIYAIAIAVLMTGCSAPSKQPDGPLPILEDYPTSINATAMTGSIQLQTDGCLIFTRSDGEKMLPVFRPGSTIESLQSQLGVLTDPRPISIMGVTVLESVPEDIAGSSRKCGQTPFVFGNIGATQALPPAPPAGVPSQR